MGRVMKKTAALQGGVFVLQDGDVTDHRAIVDEPLDEDTKLALAARQGDADARERLILRFVPLITTIGRAFRVEGLEFEDVVQEGALGVLRALQRYDPNRSWGSKVRSVSWET